MGKIHRKKVMDSLEGEIPAPFDEAIQNLLKTSEALVGVGGVGGVGGVLHPVSSVIFPQLQCIPSSSVVSHHLPLLCWFWCFCIVRLPLSPIVSRRLLLCWCWCSVSSVFIFLFKIVRKMIYLTEKINSHHFSAPLCPSPPLSLKTLLFVDTEIHLTIPTQIL